MATSENTDSHVDATLIIDDPIKNILGNSDTFKQNTPDAPSIVQNEPLKEITLISTTDPEIFQSRIARIFDNLQSLFTDGNNIDATSILLLDSNRSETLFDHEIAHFDTLKSLMADETFIKLIAKYNLPMINPRLVASGTWGQDDEGKVIFGVHGAAKSIPDGDIFENSFLTDKWSSEDIYTFVTAAQRVGFAPQFPSQADYQKVIGLCDKALYILKSEEETKGKILSLKIKALEKNKKQTIDNWNKHKEELNALLTGGAKNSLTARYFNHFIQQDGVQWIEKRMGEIDNVLRIMASAPDYVIFNPEQMWIGSKL